MKREAILRWLRAGLDAVEPERLTRIGMEGRVGPLTVLAIGKAAPSMCRGAEAAVGAINGLCIASHAEPVPSGVELVLGDHPTPAEASLRAGLRALEMSPRADVALISGGGSSLCEVPVDGMTIEFVADVHEKLLDAGAAISDLNLVRAYLSKVKGGGLGPIPTYLISDVAGAGPEVVSSGPTIWVAPDPDRALEVMRQAGVSIDRRLEDLVRDRAPESRRATDVVVLADGRTAAHAVADAVDEDIPTTVAPEWIVGNFREQLVELMTSSKPGITVATGEPSVPAGPQGRGGRNTHAALTAGMMIEGTGAWFAALATDGVDGRSGAAGAIVDGTTIPRGGDPTNALERFDSATYLEATGDLIEIGPTGTNVADLWLIWKPEDGPQPILSS